MSGKLEKPIQNEVMIAASARGALVRRLNVGAAHRPNGGFVRFGVTGQADLSLIYRGRAIEVETKRAKGGRQDKAQEDYQAAVERAGGIYILARSVEDVLTVLDRLDDRTQPADTDVEQPFTSKGSTNA